MKKIIALVFFGITAIGANAQSVEATFDAFYAATGGKAKWDSVSKYTLTQSFVANAPTDYDMEVNVSVPDKNISRRKTIMKRDFFYVVSGNKGWLKIPMGSLDKNVKYSIKDLSEKEKNAMQQEIKDGVVPFLNYPEKGFAATLGGTEKVGTKTTQKITLKRNDLTLDLFFDTATGMLAKEIYTTADATETWENTNFAKTANGLVYPSEAIYTNSKDKKATKVTSKLEVNNTLNSTLFIRE